MLIKLANRHPLRSAHIHFIVSALGYETLITQVFASGDKTIKTDVVFTASENMTGSFVKKNDHYELHYDFQLTPGISICTEAPIK
ncbi:MAG: hypothetical protein A3E87_07580 [Gammaproteobacteria bacterium RIFCSPHIGHO2_12_FULL_35_23]|nr:MAG: hypothetical protein A3E87_07580 [Gammaproteobacteria bacterium RIFCSPHIGHO2_12_FULL_35_23]